MNSFDPPEHVADAGADCFTCSLRLVAEATAPPAEAGRRGKLMDECFPLGARLLGAERIVGGVCLRDLMVELSQPRRVHCSSLPVKNAVGTAGRDFRLAARACRFSREGGPPVPTPFRCTHEPKANTSRRRRTSAIGLALLVGFARLLASPVAAQPSPDPQTGNASPSAIATSAALLSDEATRLSLRGSDSGLSTFLADPTAWGGTVFIGALTGLVRGQTATALVCWKGFLAGVPMSSARPRPLFPMTCRRSVRYAAWCRLRPSPH